MQFSKAIFSCVSLEREFQPSEKQTAAEMVVIWAAVEDSV
jgi:hypothetical protein